VKTQSKLEQLQSRVAALQEGSASSEAVKFAVGQSLLTANDAKVPTSPNVALVLGLTAIAALVSAIWLALRLDQWGPRRAEPIKAPDENSGLNGWLATVYRRVFNFKHRSNRAAEDNPGPTPPHPNSR
jgi:hypothetical protein